MKILKKLLMLSLIVLSVVACSNEDEPDLNMGPAQATLFGGSWSFVSSSTNGVDDTIDDCAAQVTMVFIEAGMGIRRFERSGVDCEVQVQRNGTFSLNGSNLTITLGPDPTTFEIITLDNKVLSLRSVVGNDTFVENYAR